MGRSLKLISGAAASVSGIVPVGYDGLAEVARCAGSTVPLLLVVGAVGPKSAGCWDEPEAGDALGEELSPGCVSGEVESSGPAVVGDLGGDREQP